LASERLAFLTFIHTITKLNTSPNIVRVLKTRTIRWAGNIARRNMRLVYKILVGEHEGKRICGRPWSRWEDNIERDLWEIAWEGVDWMQLAQDRDQWWGLVNTIMNLRVPWKCRKFLD
jgi:hypothetical protein